MIGASYHKPTDEASDIVNILCTSLMIVKWAVKEASILNFRNTNLTYVVKKRTDASFKQL